MVRAYGHKARDVAPSIASRWEAEREKDGEGDEEKRVGVGGGDVGDLP